LIRIAIRLVSPGNLHTWTCSVVKLGAGVSTQIHITPYTGKVAQE
jgi:hypothetical protein